LSAKRFQTLLIVAGITMLVCAVASTFAQTARPGASSLSPDGRLTRDDVELVLRQARSAIERGAFDEAEALVRRAEGANMRYTLFHLGPTPTSVRRELNRARNSQPAAKQPVARVNGQPLSNATGNPSGDPFLAREQASGIRGGNLGVPNQPTSITPFPPPSIGGQMGAVAQSGTPAAQHTLAVGNDAANPFHPQRNQLAAQAGYDAPVNADYPVARANWEQDGAAATVSDSPNEANSAIASDRNAPWALPDAPLPRGMSYPLSVPSANPEMLPGQRSTAAPLDGGAGPGTSPKQKALAHLMAARSALEAGDIELAENLTRAAGDLGVPESQFLPDEDRPSLLAWDIERARQNQRGARPAASRLPAVAPQIPAALRQPGDSESAITATQGEAEMDPQHAERWATLPEPLALPSASSPLAEPRTLPTNRSLAGALGDAPVDVQPQRPAANNAVALMQAGEAALTRHDRNAALNLFAQAHAVRGGLNLAEQQKLQDRLQMLAAEPVDTTVTPGDVPMPLESTDSVLVPPTTNAELAEQPPLSAPGAATPPGTSEMLEITDENEKALARQLSAEVGKRQSEAKRLRETDSERAIAILREAQQMVEQSKLSEAARRELLGRINITLVETQKFADDSKAELDLDQQNAAVLAEVERRREVKLKVQQKTAELVDEFNRLKDEHRYAEAEIIAKRLIEMSPDDPVAQQVYQTAKFIRREMMNRDLADRREESNWLAWNDVEESSINPVAESGKELVFDQKTWDLLKNRKSSRELLQRRTERELEIERRLKTPVMLRYQETPLRDVVDDLSELTGVNIHLDPRGLTQEGYTAETPVSVNLTKEISLKSALSLILEPLHLSYVIKDEVLKITSEQLRDGELSTEIYNVADLVIPIPNFVPNSNIGLQGLIHDAHAAMGYGSGLGMPGPAVLVNGKRAPDPAAPGENVLAQQLGVGAGATGAGVSPGTVPIGPGPGGMGAGANADFDSLIDLIVSTVHTETWAENGGGEAEIRPFPTNLSLVISQTQEIHEEIADLLEQLRRLQDLQVTIEVRFIRLNDRFFERIGIDFDLNIEDRTIGTADLIPGQPFEPGRQSATVGLSTPVTGIAPFPNFTADLDIPFRQGSFAGAVPPVFGGFDPNSAATFGFAILSDLEAYFLIEAAQGDSRTNILNAPKVTLFNGQIAFVADAVQQPFVIGVIPVVGEFVAAQQPVIVVLNEGTMMSIQAVVSDDRRYVRMTVVPFFTEVGDVEEFTFEGSSSTTNSSSSTDDDDDGKNEAEEESEEQSRSGVTVQLPAFQFVSVTTTVSVPDGGTVLLGGIKRLSEGRNEFGVPLLSKVPYINRLFRNVGIGRDTDSLMMMVTPRIIIQEEEEERLGVTVP
jgi:general secretion pathway protein D